MNFKISGALVAIFFGIVMSAAVKGDAHAQVVVCDSGTNLSYHQAVDAIASGDLIVARSADTTANIATMIVTNNTACGVEVSLSSYRMYIDYDQATLAEQEFFKGTPVSLIAPGATETLVIEIPACLSQYDLWYGPAPIVIPNNSAYGAILSGDQVRLGEYCVPVVVAPVVPPVVVVPPEIAPVVALAPVAEVEVYEPSGSSSGGSRVADVEAVLAVSTITTVVALPLLPDAGFAPGGKSLLLSFASMLGILALFYSLLPGSRRKIEFALSRAR